MSSKKNTMLQQIENLIESFVVTVGYPTERMNIQLKIDLLRRVLDRL